MRLILIALALVFSAQAEARLSVSPWWLDFRDVEVGKVSRTEYLRLRNDGREVIDRINISDNCFGDVEVRNQSCRYRLEPFQSCELRVTFRPRTTGSQFCEIRFQTFGSYERVSVQGRGVKKPAPQPAPLADAQDWDDSEQMEQTEQVWQTTRVLPVR